LGNHNSSGWESFRGFAFFAILGALAVVPVAGPLPLVATGGGLLIGAILLNKMAR
jgi:hypothetical protein